MLPSRLVRELPPERNRRSGHTKYAATISTGATQIVCVAFVLACRECSTAWRCKSSTQPREICGMSQNVTESHPGEALCRKPGYFTA
jgi:hypothetical protein